MPCRDYDSDAEYFQQRERELKTKLDLVTRVACKAMTELERYGVAAAILLRDREVDSWWHRHKELDRAERKKEEEKRKKAEEKKRLAAIKKEVLSRLTDDEKKALGIKK
jgi:hypothetical protein